jgi:MFS transporter, PPP family, 3-phenylpropionic acid transporter
MGPSPSTWYPTRSFPSLANFVVGRIAEMFPESPALYRFIVLYALLYAAFGVSSPFMPTFFEGRGLAPGEIGLLFAAGTAIRLVSGPLAGRLADLTQALRAVLAVCALVAALVALGLLSAPVFTPLLLTSLLQAAALAPTTTLADTLAIGAAQDRHARRGFEYGWVRGAGSGVFVIGTLVSGQVVASWGLRSIIVLQAVLLVAAAGAATLVPPLTHHEPVGAAAPTAPTGLMALLRMARFRRVMLVSGLVLGSHAMHDTFAVIRWSAAGVTPAVASALWSESVAAEVIVFFVIGPPLLARLGPPAVLTIAAAGGVVRWLVMASSTSVTALALVQPLHGLTFAALHLACMRLIPAIVPERLAATAQAMYALAAGATTALLTLASGWLYAIAGAHGFLVMALLCVFAVPLTARRFWRVAGQ